MIFLNLKPLQKDLKDNVLFSLSEKAFDNTKPVHHLSNDFFIKKNE